MENNARELQEEEKDANTGRLMLWVDLNYQSPELADIADVPRCYSLLYLCVFGGVRTVKLSCPECSLTFLM